MQIRIMTEVGTCFKNKVNLDAANVHCTGVSLLFTIGEAFGGDSTNREVVGKNRI